MKTIRKIAKIEYALMAYNLVLLLYLLVAIPVEVIVTGKYAVLVFLGSALVAGLAGYACYQAGRRVSVIHLLSIAFYLWMLVSIAYHFGETGAENMPQVLLFFCFVFPCFLSFFSYTKAQYLTQCKVLAVGYNLAVSLLCVVGIWCTLADVYITFPAVGYNYIGFVALKLYIFAHYNSVAQFIGVAILLAVFMLCVAGKKWVKVCFALDLALLCVTLALTYSRTAELTLLACGAIALCYFIWHAPRLQLPTAKVKGILLRLALCGATFVAVVVAGYFAMVQVNTAVQAYLSATRAANGTGQVTVEGLPELSNLGQLRQDKMEEILKAEQETPDSTEMTEEEYIEYLQDTRSLKDLSTMASRLYYWKAALGYFASSPECQIVGVSPAGVVGMLSDALVDADPPHAHNVFVQVLVALGVPGLILFVALWGTSLFYAVKAFFAKQHGFALGCMPLLVLLAFTAMGLQENMMLSAETTLMLPAFFMAVATTARLAQKAPQV